MFKLVALGGLATTWAAVGNKTALCQMLLNGPCANTTNMQFPGDINQTTCETIIFANAVDGDDAATSGDTIGCRQNYAMQAQAAGKAHFCRFAGVTGGGRCGAPLDGACRGIVDMCPTSYADVPACTANLTALGNFWGSKQGAAGGAEDSLECRVYHATVGINTVSHCDHVFGPGSAGQPCSGPIASDGEHYCDVLEATCTGANKQYNDFPQCTKSFATFPDANVTASNVNTRGSRQYHAQVAASGALVHCQHAGPSGGGVCGSVAEAWISLANSASCKVATPFLGFAIASAVAAWKPTDLAIIVPPGDATTYTVAASGNTDLCRLYHLTVATVDPTHCMHGDFGSKNAMDATLAAACAGAGENFLDNVCRVIQTACGTQVYNTTAACLAGIVPILARPGVPPMNATSPIPDDDTFACRLANAGIALAQRKANNSVAVTAACDKVAGMGGCRVAPTPAPKKSAAPVLAASSALALLALLL